jgi:hypothetical protein
MEAVCARAGSAGIVAEKVKRRQKTARDRTQFIFVTPRLAASEIVKLGGPGEKK